MPDLDAVRRVLQETQSGLNMGSCEAETPRNVLREFAGPIVGALAMLSGVGAARVATNVVLGSDLEALKGTPAISLHGLTSDPELAHLLDGGIPSRPRLSGGHAVFTGETLMDHMFNVELLLQLSSIAEFGQYRLYSYEAIGDGGTIEDGIRVVSPVPIGGVRGEGDLLQATFAVAPWEIKYISEVGALLCPAQTPKGFEEKYGADGYLIWAAEPK